MDPNLHANYAALPKEAAYNDHIVVQLMLTVIKLSTLYIVQLKFHSLCIEFLLYTKGV